jgi:hypothetical protein
MPSLIFSKSKEGTVHQFAKVQVNVVPVIVQGLSYSMIDRLVNSTKCGKCKGAK